MRYVRIWLFCLSLFCCGWLATGWFNPVMAAVDKEKATAKPTAVEGEIQFEGRGEGFKPEPAKDECPSTFGPIITDTAIPIEKGKFALQPTFGLSFTTHNFSPSWRRVSAGGNFTSFGMDWKFTYGLCNNLEVFVVVPFVHNWANSVNEPGPKGERAASFGGIGDVNLTFKYRLLEETETRPTVTALFATDFPTGHFRHFNPRRLGTDEIGGGAYAFTTGLNLSKYIKPFVLYGNLWYTVQTAFTGREDRSPLVAALDEGGVPTGELVEGDPLATKVRNYPRDIITLNLAAEYPITKKWVALLELTSSWDGGRLFGHKANVAPVALLSVMPGIEYMATEKFSLALGVNIDLAGKNTSANITPLLSMVYAF
ncbi:MAG: transporter [Proteobacteria bacterium]|nr:transporter [Pseudomonadota bacterium]